MLSILEEDERTELIPEVALLTEGRPTRLVKLIPTNHVIRIPTDPIPEQYAFNVVRYCELSAWVEEPPLIIKLLENWAMYEVFDKAIKRLTTGAPPKYYHGDRVWDTCLLALDLPFLNRETTRLAIEYFSYPLIPSLKPAGLRVLVVRGPARSGKSFTYDYILYVNSVFARLNFNAIWVDFKKQITSRFGPLELVESLLDQVNPSWESEVFLPELDTQQPVRWMLELARILVDQINTVNQNNVSDSKWIIVLDGFDDEKVARDTIEMIQIIASVAVGAELSGESNDVIRLVLLGFSDSIINYRNRVKVDDILPIDRNGVKLYFKRYGELKGKLLNDAALEGLVDAIEMEKIDGEEYRTRMIAHKALQIAQAVLQ